MNKSIISKIPMLILVITVSALLISTSTVASSEAVIASKEVRSVSSYYANGVNVNVMSQNPCPARPGEVVELILSVQNLGYDDISNMEIRVDPEYPFSQVTGESLTKSVTNLKARQDDNELSNVKFKLKVNADAPKKVYELSVYAKDTKSEASVKHVVSVDIQGKEYAQIVTISKSCIDIATVEPLDFIITNTGTSPLKNMAVSWEDASGTILPVYSDNTKYINYLDAGESVNISYAVMADVNARPGLYPIDIDLSFQNSDTQANNIRTRAGIFIGGDTDFDVAYSESSAGAVSLSIANIGNNQAYSVKVSVPEQENFKTTGTSSNIVGNLEKGDYTITSFSILQNTLNASSSSNKENTKSVHDELKVLIEYTDTTGNRQTVDKTVHIGQLSSGAVQAVQNKGGAQSSSTNYLMYGFGIVVLIAIGIYIKKAKK